MIEDIFAISKDVRYVAIYRDGLTECFQLDIPKQLHEKLTSRAKSIDIEAFIALKEIYQEKQ